MATTRHPLPRGLTPAALGRLDRALRQQIGLALVAERGYRVVEVIPRADFDDVVIRLPSVLRSRPARIRILYRSLRPHDVNDLKMLSQAQGELEGVLFEAASATRETIPSDPFVDIVRANALIDRIEASALIDWKDGTPGVNRGLFGLLRRSSSAFLRFDTVGIRWLPWLARNKVPPELTGGGGTVDSLLEDAVFRLFTLAFRFDGDRYGSTKPGTAAPDSLLHLPLGRDSAVVDCKAARDAYKMNAADARALKDYVKASRKSLRGTQRRLRYVLVVSSEFAGIDDRRHPYFNRARSFNSELSVKLVYLRADDLIRFAIRIEELAMTPSSRSGLDWAALFAVGRPTESSYAQLLP